jgi:hypothetical protein
MNAMSPWAAAANYALNDSNAVPLYTNKYRSILFTVFNTGDSIWIRADFTKGGRIGFRPAYSPGGDFTISRVKETPEGIILYVVSATGKYKVDIRFPEGDNCTLRYTTTLQPATDLLIPFWPRDIIIAGKHANGEGTAGKIHMSQEGTRSGIIYFSCTRPKAASVFYLQNLSALGDYCEQTKTSGGDTVGGTWPELGFALPVTKDACLPADKKFVISDAIILLSNEVPANEKETTHQFLDLMAGAYLQLPRPESEYNDWPQILQWGLKDLLDVKGCWSHNNGHSYFNAYLCDYETPPEIMVQLAVLLPLKDYTEWNGTDLDVMKMIMEGLPAFYNEELKTIMRWLPSAEDKLEGDEEQKQPRVMDSWYLHHPMLNLSRLALKGDKQAKKLFLNSIGFVIKVAKHFKYKWPVFYNMETLEIVKAERESGKGGENDVAGLYAHVMLQAYELTGEKKYLAEAERAAKALQGLGFELLYQANNTAFASGALLRLHKITGKKLYLELSYLCIANLLRNVRLWSCNYGNGKFFPVFFSMFPLSNAPYTAPYEEQEVFCAMHDYLRHAEGIEILPSIQLLIAEFIRFMMHRAVYYYPTMLPAEMICEDVKTGEFDPALWIAVEDLNDGWEKSGSVGQEVYGAGNAFGILPRHYLKIPGKKFMVYVDYPTAGFKARKGSPIRFRIKGDSRISCRLCIIPDPGNKVPALKVFINGASKAEKGTLQKDGRVEYFVRGNSEVLIR